MVVGTLSGQLMWYVCDSVSREVQEARADRVLGQLIDDDDAARVPVVRIGIEGDHAVQADVADSDFVEG